MCVPPGQARSADWVAAGFDGLSWFPAIHPLLQAGGDAATCRSRHMLNPSRLINKCAGQEERRASASSSSSRHLRNFTRELSLTHASAPPPDPPGGA